MKTTKIMSVNVFKKMVLLGVVLIMCLGIFTACRGDYEKDKVLVSINFEYKEKFLAEEFTAEFFGWENIERIEYRTWYSNNNPEIGFLTIYLKKHGKKQVNDAIKHFNTLDFVNSAGASYYAYMF